MGSKWVYGSAASWMCVDFCFRKTKQNNQPSKIQTLGQTLIQWEMELGCVTWEKSGGPDSSRLQVTCSSFGNAEWLEVIANTEKKSVSKLHLFLNKYRIWGLQAQQVDALEFLLPSKYIGVQWTSTIETWVFSCHAKIRVLLEMSVNVHFVDVNIL